MRLRINNYKKIFANGQLKYILLLTFVVALFILVLYLLVVSINKIVLKRDEDKTEKELKNDVGKIIPNFSFLSIEKELIETYKLFLDYWKNRDLEKIKDITTSEFYEYLLRVAKDLEGYKDSIDILSMPTSELINMWSDGSYIILQVGFKFKSINYITWRRKIVFGENVEESMYTEIVFKVNGENKILIDKKIVGLPCFSKNFFKK